MVKPCFRSYDAGFFQPSLAEAQVVAVSTGWHCHREGYLFIYFFFAAGFVVFWGGFLVLCFPVSLIFCFSAFLLLCFSASLLSCFSAFCFPCFSAFPASLLSCFSAFCFPCFSAFPASLLFCFLLFLLLCFSASLFSLLLCFCTSVPFYFYYSNFSFLQSCVFCCSTSCSFASLLPVFTVSMFFHFLLLYSVLFCILNETLERP